MDMDETIKSLDDFRKLVAANPGGVVLLEGKRAIPPEWAARAKATGAFLAKTFPKLRFRSGNALGADEAFSQGVASVDATRLHIIAPYRAHRKSQRIAGAIYDAPDAYTPAQEAEIIRKTIAASPHRESFFSIRHTSAGIGANYLIRDTMKVVGHSEKFPPAMCGLFYVNPATPLSGGTGHTIRACINERIPALSQAVWGDWATRAGGA